MTGEPEWLEAKKAGGMTNGQEMSVHVELSDDENNRGGSFASNTSFISSAPGPNAKLTVAVTHSHKSPDVPLELPLSIDSLSLQTCPPRPGAAKRHFPS